VKVRVEEVERRVGETEGVIERRERREREYRKRELREKEDRERKAIEQQGGIHQTVLRNLKMLALAWSISIPALSSSPPTSPPPSSISPAENPQTDSSLYPNPERRRRTPRAVTHRRLEQLYNSLPQYVLLVGIGACAYVLRGLVRRVWGVGVRVSRW